MIDSCIPTPGSAGAHRVPHIKPQLLTLTTSIFLVAPQSTIKSREFTSRGTRFKIQRPDIIPQAFRKMTVASENSTLDVQWPTAPGLTFRLARPSDAFAMARSATLAYYDSELTEFLWPHRQRFPNDFILGFARRYRIGLCEPNKFTILAVDPLNNIVAGYGTFSREGTDAGKWELVRRQRSLWRTIQLWWYKLLEPVLKWWSPNRAADASNMAHFMMLNAQDHQQVWDKMYPNRYHCRSFVTHPDYQRRGIGSKIMRMVMDMAKREKVPIVLEASPEGEKLYNHLGYRLVSRFPSSIFNNEPELGGLMVYEPDTM